MTEKPSLERRQFLNKITAVVGGSASLAVAAPLVQATTEITQEKTPVEPAKSKGYQRTQHVDTYYHLADF
jgi:hypothetical protein